MPYSVGIGVTWATENVVIRTDRQTDMTKVIGDFGNY
jgi:hypothetical protein